jgi:tRNA A-37 threonylcarbamoyl transferase component Bud32
MTLRIRKRTPLPSAPASGGAPATRGMLRPDLLAAGSRRLAVIALIAAAAAVLFAIVDRLTFPFDARSAGAALWLFALLGIVGISLSVAWIAYREMLSPEKLLDLGLFYEVAAALCLGIVYHSVPLNPDVLPRGWSGVAVWILAFPLVVPNTWRKTALATAAAALMDPVSLGATVLAGAPAPSPRAAGMLFLPTVVAGCVALVISRIMYELAVAAGKGQDMGSYRLEELLGRGGMGEVWRASHRLLARSAAVKLIRIEAGTDSRELQQRFEREARATAALRSPHTVDVYDYGTTEDGTFYYVMELLEGFDLETLVARFGLLPPERAVFLLEQACHSLGEAHQGGLIHRDVKPANIYVCRYGIDWDFVKLLDFGLVKNPAVSDGRQVTVTGVIAGTPGYMSPEMGLGSPDVDWRTDIYALGCVAYWMVTGHRVFEGGSPMQILMDHIQKLPVPPSQRIDTAIPPELDRVIMACLQKDPSNRPQTMQELAEGLRAVPLRERWTEERARRWWLANGSRSKEPAQLEGAVPEALSLESAPRLAREG